MSRDGSFELALLGRVRRVHDSILSVASGRNNLALNRIVDLVSCVGLDLLAMQMILSGRFEESTDFKFAVCGGQVPGDRRTERWNEVGLGVRGRLEEGAAEASLLSVALPENGLPEFPRSRGDSVTHR